MNTTSRSTMMRQIGQTLGALFIGLCLIAIILSVTLPIGTRAAVTQVALAPAADTFVKSSDPDRNYGTSGQIGVIAKPQTRGLLRFAVTGIGQNSVGQAHLRLFVSDASPAAGLKIFRTDANWDETAVTWNKQPALGPQVAELAPIAMNLGSWIEVSLGQSVTGDGVYSFALTTDSSDRIAFRSRTQAEAPQLVLTLNTNNQVTPTTTAVPTSAPTLVASGPLIAFPGADGFGATTPGGRGGRIIYVTTLADWGVGSLRAALEASGPRTVLFKVAGTIVLQKDIKIEQPYLTIAGQSAPGEGVQIRGGMIKIETHDIVIRYLKMRPGDALNNSSITDRDAITLAGLKGGEVYNVIIDHCSMVWGPDIGGLSILTNVHHVTVQSSIIGEGPYYSNHPEAIPPAGHSKAMNITKLSDSYGTQRPSYITLHHNLFTSSDDRMPQIIGAVNVDLVNNLSYNWGKDAGTGNPVSLNMINNMFIAGPRTTRKMAWHPNTSGSDPDLHTNAVYERGTVTVGFSMVRGDPQTVYAATRFAPYSISAEQTAQDAYNRIVQDVGARLPVRDSADQRIINNLIQRTGTFLNGSDLAWPTLASGPVPADTDNDGMPDSWEQAQFSTLNRSTANDTRSDFDQDGYTDVEEYLNNTNPKVADR